MAHLFRESYYCADLLIGFGGTLLLTLLYRLRRLRPWIWNEFWIGVGIGLVEMLCAQPACTGFRWRELLVLIAWSQISELCWLKYPVSKEGVSAVYPFLQNTRMPTSVRLCRCWLACASIVKAQSTSQYYGGALG